MDGDKLHSVLRPNATDQRLKRLERDVRRAEHAGYTITPPSIGESGVQMTPTVDSSDVTLTVGEEYSADGTRRITLGVGVSTASASRSVRGFIGYKVRIIPPEGDVTERRNLLDSNLQLPTMTIKNAIPTPVNSAPPALWYAQVQTLSSIYGASRWSDLVPFTVNTPSVAPAAPSGVVVSNITSGYYIKWGKPTEADYHHTDIYLSIDNVIDTTVDLSIGPAFSPGYTFIWPHKDYGPTGQNYQYIGTRHVSTANLASAWTVTAIPAPTGGTLMDTTQISNGAITDAKIATTGITTASKLAPQTSSSEPFVVWDKVNNEEALWVYISGGTGNAVLQALFDAVNSANRGLELRSSAGQQITLNPDGTIYIQGSPSTHFFNSGGVTEFHDAVQFDVVPAGLGIDTGYAAQARWSVG